MPAFNKTFLMGNLTRDPELKHTQGGATICEFSMAINRRWTDKDGQKKEEVDFFDVLAWNKMAELCSQYLKKGKPVMIEGHLKQDRWMEQSSGQKRSRVRVVVERVTFLDSGRRENQEGAPAGNDLDEPF